MLAASSRAGTMTATFAARSADGGSVHLRVCKRPRCCKARTISQTTAASKIDDNRRSTVSSPREGCSWAPLPQSPAVPSGSLRCRAVAAMPAILVASTQGLNLLIWTVVAYLAIHQIEGNLVVPLIQRQLIFIPPAVVGHRDNSIRVRRGFGDLCRADRSRCVYRCQKAVCPRSTR